MQAAGGVAPDEPAAALPVLTIGSGPSAGVAASSVLARRAAASRDVIATDMGGTSFDVGADRRRPARPLAVDRRATSTSSTCPRTDIRSIGARRRQHHLARSGVGHAARRPARAPAPTRAPSATAAAATEPTVTDANLVLGYLDPDNFLGGELQLDREARRAAPSSSVGRAARA